jgi:hypothetical protein
MAIKASFAAALFVSVAIGLVLPAPSANRTQPTQSAFETVHLKRG